MKKQTWDGDMLAVAEAALAADPAVPLAEVGVLWNVSNEHGSTQCLSRTLYQHEKECLAF